MSKPLRRLAWQHARFAKRGVSKRLPDETAVVVGIQEEKEA
jgi:hypothetical protein